MSEILKQGLNVIRKVAPLLLGSAALIGCGESSPLDSDEERTTNPTITHTYYDSGLRRIEYHGEAGHYADVLQFCDGHDLVEQTDFQRIQRGGSGNSLTRSVGHQACEDMVLTNVDFEAKELR